MVPFWLFVVVVDVLVEGIELIVALCPLGVHHINCFHKFEDSFWATCRTHILPLFPQFVSFDGLQVGCRMPSSTSIMSTEMVIKISNWQGAIGREGTHLSIHARKSFLNVQRFWLIDTCILVVWLENFSAISAFLELGSVVVIHS